MALGEEAPVFVFSQVSHTSDPPLVMVQRPLLDETK